MSTEVLNNAGLGPCDLSDPHWVAKMSSVAIAGGAVKRRKKADIKPNAQLTKCLNEKKRREQENIWIEDLAKLISSGGFSDMSSVSMKPDKCAILQETVSQIRRIREQESASIDPVQQGEVSSSKPTVLGNEVLGPLLLEALQGFLFIVNKESHVEFVTENVSDYIKYTKDEVMGKSIYNFVHLGDTTRFSTILLPITQTGWTSEPSNYSRNINCRLMIKPDVSENDMEEKRPQDPEYENMQVCSCLEILKIGTTEPISYGVLKYPSDKTDSNDISSESAENNRCLMCLARRIPQNDNFVEHFTMKLDVNGRIIRVDTSGVTHPYSQYLAKDMAGHALHQVCHPQDLEKVTQHLREVVNTSTHTSSVYRLRVKPPDKYIQVQSKSKYFKNTAQETDFIMATQAIIVENEESGHLSNSPCSVLSVNQSNSTFGSSGNSNNALVGGPLLSGAVNGQVSVSASRNSGISSTDFGASASSSDTSYTYILNNNELGLNDFDLLSSSWENVTSSGWGERPDSRQSLTPVSTPTPRPPSGPGFSPSSMVCPSPLNPYPVVTQPSPATQTSASFNSFHFSPIQDQGGSGGSFSLEENKDSKDGASEVGNSSTINGGENSSTPGESGRLRTLLQRKPSTLSSDDGVSDSVDNSGTSDGSDVRNKHLILKNLLNQDEDDDCRRDSVSVPQASPSNRNLVGSRHHNDVTKPSSQMSSGNNMLLKLLNEKSDDDDIESRAGLKNQNELLQQLLKDDEPKPPITLDTGQEESLLKSLYSHTAASPSSNSDQSVLNVSSLIGSHKRLSNESTDMETDSLKRGGVHTTTSVASSLASSLTSPLTSSLTSSSSLTSVASSMSSSTPTPGSSKLWEKNKMLASLLAKEPTQPTNIPPIPTEVLRATPQDSLAKVVEKAKQSHQVASGGWAQSSVSSSRPNQLQQDNSRQVQAHQSPQGSNFLNQMLTQDHSQKLQQQMGGNQPMDTGLPSSVSEWTPDQSDPLLSDILDQVIDIVPEVGGNSSMMDIKEASGNNAGYGQDMNEKMAIKFIQKSLMQIETTVKSPIPGTPPAYTSPALPEQSGQQGSFPPPPIYPQRPRISLPAGARTHPYAIAANTQQAITAKMMQQQKRLLLRQQQQQMLIPSNATADPGLQNIESLLNNTVAPNVSLQRSSSVPDSQLSPNYGGQLVSSGNPQMSPGQRLNQQPYSPHSQLTSPLGQQQGFPPVSSGMNNFTANQQGAQARLSPHPPGGLPSFQQSQLSPRISQSQPGYPSSLVTSQAQQVTNNWNQAAPRLSLQQQQNPMLNAQLTGSYSGNNSSRSFVAQRNPVQPSAGGPQQQLPSVRSLPSPGGPFQNDQFAPPVSPNANNYQRLHRTISAPSATMQLPGAVNPTRHYGMKQEHLSPSQHPFHPSEAPHPHHLHQMLYHPLPDSQFCFDQASLQTYGANERGRQAGGGNNVMSSSEYVRQELRAVVGARTQQQTNPSGQQRQHPQIPLGPGGHHLTTAELESYGLSYEMSTPGASESPNLWGNIGSDLGSGSPQPGLSSSRSSMEESPRLGDKNSSLLQKLLSE